MRKFKGGRCRLPSGNYPKTFQAPSKIRRIYAGTCTVFLNPWFPRSTEIPRRSIASREWSLGLHPNSSNAFVSFLPFCPSAYSGNSRNDWHPCTCSCRHFPKIQYLSLSHAEGWTDINIWGPLIDQAFLFSESLSLDRYVSLTPLFFKNYICFCFSLFT